MFTQLLPHLEEFSLDCCKSIAEGEEFDENDVLDMFGMEDNQDCDPVEVKYPRLKKLVLDLRCANRYYVKSIYPVAVAEQLVSAAYHFPMLSQLSIEMYQWGSYPSLDERLTSMAATMKEIKAFPLMKKFTSPLSKIYSLRSLWPQATFSE